MTMTLIQTQTLGTAVASIEFTSIPQTYTDLVLVSSLRDGNTQQSNVTNMTFNSNSANRTVRQLVGFGNNSSGSFTGSYMIGARISGTASTSNSFASSVLYIPNYAGSSQKSSSVDTVSETNATDSIQELVANLWADTSAITSIQMPANTGNYVVGSTVSLYGILKGSSGGVVVS